MVSHGLINKVLYGYACVVQLLEGQGGNQAAIDPLVCLR